MQRAIIATAATAAGLVALLDYRSGGGRGHTLSLGTVVGAPGTPPSASTPSTTVPGTSDGSGTGATPTASPSTTPPSAASPTTAASARSATGDDVSYQYGDLQVRVTVTGGKLTAITVPVVNPTDGRSASIDDEALPILTSEALAAKGGTFDAVSGATYTSDAFAQSLRSAIQRAGS